MPDREKYIDIFKQIVKAKKKYYRNGEIPIRISYQCVVDILTLLKEQEAVKPRISSAEQRCGNCNKVIEMDGWKACPWCGKPILWEAVGRSVK